MVAFKDLTGQRFHHLTVKSYAGKNKHNQTIWNCECDCGILTIFSSLEIHRGRKSCGDTKNCKFAFDIKSKARMTHGMWGTPIYNTWRAMLRRCEDPKFISFKDYGAKGIKVCKRWHEFENFYEDMGVILY